MAAQENIEIFNRIGVALFEKLYSAFPGSIDTDANGVTMSAIPEDASYKRVLGGSQGTLIGASGAHVAVLFDNSGRMVRITHRHQTR
jgi:hypothetical protein